MTKTQAMNTIEFLRAEYISLSSIESEKRIAIETVMGILMKEYFDGVRGYYEFRS